MQETRNDGNGRSSGSNAGTLKVTAADTITCPDDISGRTMALDGTFEVVRCT